MLIKNFRGKTWSIGGMRRKGYRKLMKAGWEFGMNGSPYMTMRNTPPYFGGKEGIVLVEGGGGDTS